MFEQLIQYKKKITRVFGRKDPYRKIGIRPGEDWWYICIIALTICLFSTVGALGFYSEVQSGSLWQDDDASTLKPIKINQLQLDDTVQYFSHKKEVYSTLRQFPATVPDPSL